MQYESTAISMTQMQPGTSARVLHLNCTGAIRRRLQDMGLIEGTQVECLFRHSRGGPCAYQIRGAAVALRPADSDQILVAGRCSP